MNIDPATRPGTRPTMKTWWTFPYNRPTRPPGLYRPGRVGRVMSVAGSGRVPATRPSAGWLG